MRWQWIRIQEDRKNSGEENKYRVRQGNYRIVYSIDDRNRVVVTKIGDRKEVYR